MDKLLAAKLHKLKLHTKDETLWLLSSFKILSEVKDINSVINNYKNIISGKLKVVEIISSLELEKQQKDKLESRIKSEFKNLELVFIFNINEKIAKGIQITVGDDLVEL